MDIIWGHSPQPRKDHSNYETALEDLHAQIHICLRFDLIILLLGDCCDWLGQ